MFSTKYDYPYPDNPQTPDPAAPDQDGQDNDYRSPQMFALGKAEKLVRRSMCGYCRDGMSGAYCYRY